MLRPWSIALFAPLLALALPACERHGVAAEAGVAPTTDLVKVESPAAAAGAANLRLFGRVGFAPGASYAVRAPLSGYVRTVDVSVGQEVVKGTLLATIQSKDAAAARAELAQAKTELDLAKTNHDRLVALRKDGAATDKEVREAEANLHKEQTEYARAAEAVAALGLSGGSAATYELRASAAGRVLTRGIAPGERVGPEDAKETFLVGDTSKLVVIGAVFERDMGSIEKGAKASFTVTSIPGVTFAAKVGTVGDVLDPASHTLEVRFELDGADSRLRSEMATTILVERKLSAAATVPASALFLHHDQFVVMVQENGAFVRRKVVPGPVIGDRIAILEGVATTDRIVVEGALLVDSELDRVLDP